MKRRPRRSAPAVLTAAVLLVVCALVATVAIQTILGETPLITYRAAADALHSTRWADLVPLVAGGTAAVVGLVLLLASVLPGRPTVVPLRDEETTFDSGASRRSYRSTLRTAASDVDGVNAATLSLGRRKVAAVVRTDRTTTDGLADAVRVSLDQRLDQIAPEARPELKVKIKAARSDP
ncbi:alkaline shock response membrane anchor protein AmaP [Umezawaea endophytica]|uniref:Alkaline shock response membrane anchor protein AmaP n=1 Tax=Umezawaea endophytica TaxID=1654476 RepID=A0A9X2VKU9_9PSEU|nr:alkaline shock response membrane anchor protein AmaP [Umezawaea endophytica]MCS7478518.1 alkaline shock response membrane anchor protein AmaP [Umezawaea endophytica]